MKTNTNSEVTKLKIVHGNRGSTGGVWIYEIREDLTDDDVNDFKYAGLKIDKFSTDQYTGIVLQKIGWAFNKNNNTGQKALYAEAVRYANNREYYLKDGKNFEQLLESIAKTKNYKIVEEYTAA